MRSRYKFTENGYYFITSTVTEWIPIFTSKKYFQIILASLDFCQKQNKFKLHAYVILENHLHLTISGEDLSNKIKDFKSFTAKKIIENLEKDEKKWILNQLHFYKQKYKIQSNYQVWQEGVHPKLIQDEEMFRQKCDYIHNNPVKRGYVEKPEHWVYSSARWFL